MRFKKKQFFWLYAYMIIVMLAMTTIALSR